MSVSPMTTPRAVQSSTRLRDGTVLIAGGCSDPGCELGSSGGMTAEVFDPKARAFHPVGDLSGFRDDHGAILLPDGRVLLAGGWGRDEVLRTTELYDPRHETFSPGPNMSSPRAGFTPVLLPDGSVLLAGGFLDNDATTAVVDLFDPRSDTIRRIAPLTRPRGAYAAASMPDGRVLIAGGLSDGAVVASSETFDPETADFEPTASMGLARYKSAAVSLPHGNVMIIGGSSDADGARTFASTELYDPDAERFSPGPRMRWPRYKLAGSVVSLPDGSVLVAGGADRAERFDPDSRRFAEVDGHLGGDRLFLAAAPIGNREILLTGGYDDLIVPTDRAWVFTART